MSQEEMIRKELNERVAKAVKLEERPYQATLAPELLNIAIINAKSAQLADITSKRIETISGRLLWLTIVLVFLTLALLLDDLLPRRHDQVPATLPQDIKTYQNPGDIKP